MKRRAFLKWLASLFSAIALGKESETAKFEPEAPHDATRSYWDGTVSGIWTWREALTDEEIAALSMGFSPFLIRPQALVTYWSVWPREA